MSQHNLLKEIMLTIILIIIMSSNTNYAAAMEAAIQNYHAIRAQTARRSSHRKQLHPAQEQIKREAKRYNVLDCVLPDEIIAGDYNSAAQTKLGASVFGSNRETNKIERVIHRTHDGDIVSIKATGLLPVTSTPNHPILVTTVERNSNSAALAQKRRPTKIITRIGESKWTSAGDVKTGSERWKKCLSVPRMKAIPAPAAWELRTMKRIPVKGFREYYTQKEFPLNNDTAWLCGLFVAEGSVTGGNVQWTLGSHETDLIERAVDIMMELGYRPTLSTIDNVTRITCSSTSLGELFSQKFGKGARNKRVPDEFITHDSLQFVHQWLKGYFDGDGHFDSTKGRLHGKTASKILALQLQLTIARLGTLANIGRSERRSNEILGREVNAGDFYWLCMTDWRVISDIGFDCDIKNDRTFCYVTDNYIYTPIQNISRKYYLGDVYNFSTSDETFLVSNAVTHNCGRRFGKTLFLCDLLTETAEQGYPAGYFAPTFKHLMDGWRDLIEMTAPLHAKSPDQQEKRIELTTGGVIECWSLDGEGAGGKKKYKAGRSRGYKRVVIDEAALVDSLEGIYDYAIDPTLLDYKGDAWFASTPSGKGGFYRFWRKGQIGDERHHPDWMSWKMPTIRNTAIPHLAEEVENKRKTLADHIFRQEYLAEFLEDGGQVFRNISECTMKRADIWQESALPYHVYLVAWDLAKKEDFSVMGVIDCTTKRLVHFDHFNRVEYMIQVARLIAMVEKFQPVEVVVEENGNLALMEVLQQVKYKKRGPAPRLSTKWFEQDDITLQEIMMAEATMRALEDATAIKVTHPATMPITPFVATNVSKEEAIQALVLAFERGEIGIPDDITLLGELEEFGMERLPSGKFKYSAPAGQHDDFVLMLAEGWYRARRYMSIEALPLRERAIRSLAPELQDDKIIYSENESAWNSRDYHIRAFEREKRTKGTHFMNKYTGLGK